MNQDGVALERALFLKGWPSSRDYVRLIRAKVSSECVLEEAALVREWREARDRVQRLDPISAHEVAPPPRALAELGRDYLESLGPSNPYALLPHRWLMVELDKLVVWQRYVNEDFSSKLLDELPDQADDQELFAFCSGMNASSTPIDVCGTPGSNHFAFTSQTTDLRVLDTMLLDPARVSLPTERGRAGAVLAVVVGFSYNTMWAVQLGERVVLVNGTHRAHALLRRGIARAPCLVTTASVRDDLELIQIPISGAQSLDWHFSAPRPPHLRDFLDDSLVRAVVVPRTGNLLSLDLTFTAARVPMRR
jgi:hypothetical protein